MGYTKLFSSIVASTIWREDNTTRLVWITMLAMKNEWHIVETSLPGLADMARVSIPEAEAAIAKLEGPDKYSRSQIHGGRRIKKCDGGWEILNGEYYKQKLSAEDRLEYQKNWQAAKRARLKAEKEMQAAYDKEYDKRVISEARKTGKMAGAQAAIADGLEEASNTPQEEGPVI